MTGKPVKASELSHRLRANAEAVCRSYLTNGRKAGRYWQVGNVQNEKGQSMFVRLAAPGVIGKWNDANTAEHGDLLDVIQLARGLPDLASAMVEARSFLCEGGQFLGCAIELPPRSITNQPVTSNRTDMARRLYAAGRPLAGTLGEAYLNRRGITMCEGMGSLLFHPRTWFSATTYRPAIIAAVHDNVGNLTGITRLFLDKNASLIERRALGRLNGNAVRIGPINAHHVLVGEGLESALSFTVTDFGYDMAGQALAATLSVGHMAAFKIPVGVRYLTIAADKDPAGRNAAKILETRALKQGVKVRIIWPRLVDFNDDLVMLINKL